MKLILFILLLTITFTSCSVFRIHDILKHHNQNSAPDCIKDYFKAFFKHFGLDKPHQILQCFDEHSAKLFFTHLYDVGKLVQDAEERNTLQVHLDFLKLLALHKGLENLGGCIAATQDFSDLLGALGIEKRNPQLFEISKYIYYQANFGKLAQEFPQLIEALNNKDFAAAGDLHAGIFNTTVTDIQDTGLHLQILKGLWNGVHIAVGLPDAESVLSCWNNETAAIRLEFVYELANAVVNGSWNEAAYNTEAWYNQTGNALIGQIPASFWQCWANSTDTQRLDKKLNIDLASDEFHQKVAKFVHSHQGAYWHIQKAIKDSFEHLNFLHAGSAYGHFLEAVSKSD